MNIFELLKEDHRKVDALFEKCEDTTERAIKTRTQLFEKLQMELEIHAQVEEQLFYPQLEQSSKTRSKTEHAYKEHGEVKMLLKKIAALSVESEEWLEKVLELKKNVQHHVKEEENDLFPKAKEVLSEDEIEDLADRAAAMKKDMMS